MQSADLFCFSCNALLITRGEGCLIIAGGGIKDCHLQMGQIHGRLTNKTLTSLKKCFMVTTLVTMVPCCMLKEPLSFVFPHHSKRKFLTILKENSICILLHATPLQVLSVSSSTPVHSTQDTIDEKSEYLLYKLVFCLCSSQPPTPQPSWQATVDSFHSPFPWQLSPRDEGGFTRRQSAAME